MAVDYSGGYTSSASEAVCVFGTRVGCDEDSCKQDQEQVLVGRWKEGSEDIIYGHASASSHTGQAIMDWDSGREVHRVTLVGATPFKCVGISVVLCPS